MALPEPSSDWLRLFREGYAEASGFSGPVAGPEELGAHSWVLACVLLVALKARSLPSVRWILGINALFALSLNPLGLPLIALMFALTLPKSAWSYWWGDERAFGTS